MLDDEQRKIKMMRGFGVALLVVGSLVAIGMFGVLAQSSHPSAARDGVRLILSISSALLVLIIGCWIGVPSCSSVGAKGLALPEEDLL